MDTTPLTQETCPQCHASLPVHFGYVTWCESCGWNVAPSQDEQAPKALDRVYIRLSKRLSKGLFDEICKTNSLSPKLTLAKLGAYLMVLSIHTVVLALWWLAVSLFIHADDRRLLIFAIGSLLYVAWQLRPRALRPPSEALPRAQFPALYDLADRIADQLKARRIWAIVPTWQYNASVGRPALWHGPVLRLGLPLLLALDHPGKCAVIAHELAHTVNGDVSRGFLVGGALQTLADWYYVVRPSAIWPAGDTPLIVPWNLLLWALSGVINLLFTLLIHMLFRDNQRAEYLADYLAASVSGTETMIHVLEKTLLGSTFNVAMTRARNDRDIGNPYAEFERLVNEMPARELERRKRADALSDQRLDQTHPPILYRIESLHIHASHNLQEMLTETETERLNDEITRLRQQHERQQRQRLTGRDSGLRIR